MASSSSCSFPASPTSSSSKSIISEVFLSFRGEDTRKTFVDHLYSALVDRCISTYKDDVTLDRGESIGPTLFSAIEGSQIAVVIFSKNYADSSWCLNELTHIMKCNDERGLIVMPVFYDVVPSEVRKQEGEFGKGFAKQEVNNNIIKVELWRKALVDASNISGWEPKNIANGHESEIIKLIVNAISKRIKFSVNSYVDEEFVGMSTRLEQLKKQLYIGSGGVRMVGIWGIGGGGKTTLASSLYSNISHHFQGDYTISNIQFESSEHGLKTLQEKFLSRLLKTKIELQSVEEGKQIISSKLNHRNVLILLDDVSDLSQLDALAGSHSWFGSGSRIIITTRDEHLLRSHKVDLVCPIRLLSDEEAVLLFNKHAYNKDNIVNDYESLSSRVVSYAAGLPLALKVLGSFLCDKNEKEWLSSLSRLKDIPDKDIVKILRISYDGLNTIEKELFLDIACFFIKVIADNTYQERLHYVYLHYIYDYDAMEVLDACGYERDAMEVLEACGYHPDIGLKVLEQKALVTIVDGRLDMHDLVQEMGHYIVRGEESNSPEKHSRVWKYEDIMRLGDAKIENHKIEALQHVYLYMPTCEVDLSLFYKIVSNMKKLRYLSVTIYSNIGKNLKGPDFLSNGLRYIRWQNYPKSPFPDSFQPTKLVALKLYDSSQKQLWRDYKHLPLLKVLRLHDMKNLVSTPNFDGLPCLQKLTLWSCYELREIHPSLGKHSSLEYVGVHDCKKLRMFPTIVNMGKLKTLIITDCHESLEFPELESNMRSLVKLSLHNVGIEALLPSICDQCPNLIYLKLIKCSYSENIKVNFYGLNQLEEFRFKQPNHFRRRMRILDDIRLRWYHQRQISNFRLRLTFPRLTHSLRKLELSWCGLKDGEIPSGIGELFNLQELDLKGNEFTRLDFSLSQLTRLKLLHLQQCLYLVELPQLPSGLVVLEADLCSSLRTLGDFYTDCKWLSHVSLVGWGVKTGGCRLLQYMLSMIEGNALQNLSMFLAVDSLEIAKGFRPPLVKGHKFRLELPENWSTGFSGFLMCVVGGFGALYTSQLITMEEVVSGMDYEDDVAEWEERTHDKETIVRYVPFVSFKNTLWWNSSTHKELLFTLKPSIEIRGLGVKLVARKSGSDQLETLTQEEESEISNYAPKLLIEVDSPSALRVELQKTRYK